MHPTHRETINRARLAMRLTKQQVVETHGIGTDMPACVAVLRSGRLISAQEVGSFVGAGSSALAAAVELSDCDLAICAMEVYVGPDEGREPSPNELARRFAHGDQSVHEAITYVSVDRHGGLDVTFDCYHYAGRTVVWDEARPTARANEQELGRTIAAVASHAFERQAQRRRAGQPALVVDGSTLVTLGEQQVCEHLVVHAFALTHTCPCGSRLPLAECCAQRN